jgi:hypothetical protein
VKELQRHIDLLARAPKMLRVLFVDDHFGLSEINEEKGSWSGKNIIAHLILGEQTDWIPRVKAILESDQTITFDPFNMSGHKQILLGKSIDDLLTEFEELRTENIQILKATQLNKETLSKNGNHSDLGLVSVQELIVTWSLHDYNHLDQITRIFVKNWEKETGSFSQYSRVTKENKK